MYKGCDGCIWKDDCQSDIRCEHYSFGDSDEYGWSEMDYNDDKEIIDICSKREMKYWLSEVGTLK